jgi:hypothetical protein
MPKTSQIQTSTSVVAPAGSKSEPVNVLQIETPVSPNETSEMAIYAKPKSPLVMIHEKLLIF